MEIDEHGSTGFNLYSPHLVRDPQRARTRLDARQRDGVGERVAAVADVRLDALRQRVQPRVVAAHVAICESEF
jgi:hypothetical protein